MFIYTRFIRDDRNRRRHLTDKFDDWVEHLNTILAGGGGNLNDPIFKSSNARDLPGGGGGGRMLKFRVDRRIRLRRKSKSATEGHAEGNNLSREMNKFLIA